MNLWLRLYTDLPNCQKLRKLPADAQLAYVWFLCLHKEGHLVGAAETDIAWELRTGLAEVHEWLLLLTEAGLLLADHTPKGWEERQFVSDGSTPRVRAWREKHSAKQGGNVTPKRCGNVSETADVTDQRQRQRQRQNRAENTPPPPAGGGWSRWTPEQFAEEAERANANRDESKRLTAEELADFCRYWLAPTKSGKPLFVTGKTFDLPGRLATCWQRIVLPARERGRDGRQGRLAIGQITHEPGPVPIPPRPTPVEE